MELLSLLISNIGIIVQVFGAGAVVIIAAVLLWYVNRKDRESLDRRKIDLDNREDSIFERLKTEIDVYRDQLKRAREEHQRLMEKVDQQSTEIEELEQLNSKLLKRIEILEAKIAEMEQ